MIPERVKQVAVFLINPKKLLWLEPRIEKGHL
jgi:hypothetical protein